MVVQHNLTAMNSNRMLGITTGAQAKATEKLSSGYKINRAADDAAGLSISEKMRKQINGLDRASTNAQDGVSAVQTAEGALTEVHSMLQRMNELAVQAANGTNSEDDREALQNEIDQLTTEIDRVAETTKFNESYLLKGAADGETKTDYVAAHDAGLKGKLGESADGKTTFTLDKALANGDKVTIAGKEYTIGSTAKVDSTEGYNTYDSVKATTLKEGDSVTINDGTDDTTYTLVNKYSRDNLESDLGEGAKFYVEDENGGKTYYEVAADTAGGTGSSETDTIKLKADDWLDTFNQITANPNHKIVLTKYVDSTKAKTKDGLTLECVASGDIKAEEKSIFDATNAKLYTEGTVDDFVTAEAGGNTVTSVTLDGETTKITKYKPVAASDISDAVGKLKYGDKIAIDGNTYTIGTESSIAAGTTSVDEVLERIKDGSAVEFQIVATNKDAIEFLTEKGITNTPVGTPMSNVNAVTVVGDAKVDNGDNIISEKEAYDMMVKELKDASSIGADAGKGATVEADGKGGFVISQGTVEVKKSLNFSLHVGADADMTNKISIGIDSMDSASLGIKGLNIKDDTGIAATYAIDAIADAVIKVSAQRSALGAVQNRLEHTIANLDNVVENTTAAESRIRDTDMAEEMVEYSKNNILAQAGQSMLAQANQATQGVLSLLG